MSGLEPAKADGAPVRRHYPAYRLSSDGATPLSQCIAAPGARAVAGGRSVYKAATPLCAIGAENGITGECRKMGDTHDRELSLVYVRQKQP